MTRVRLLVASFVLLLGCSDFDCPEGQSRIEGMCVPVDQGSDDPDPKTKLIGLGCNHNVAGLDGIAFMRWELSVDPSAIRSGESFFASVKATAVFPEYLLNVAQQGAIPGGVSRVNVHELHATVHVRRGITDTAEESDVKLTFADAVRPIRWTCRYDNNGNAEFAGSNFPSCSPENSNLDDRSNEDCTGLDGKPNPENPCGQFVDIKVSPDCSPGGVCDSLGNPFPNLTFSPLQLCDRNEFCVTGALEVALAKDENEYHAASSGRVLFGWADESTGAEIDETSGPNDGTWKLPEADFALQPGPNGMRLEAGEHDVALECAMGVLSWSVFGVRSRDNLSSPAPDHTLISFPIQEP